jgi:hypothetical protein
VESRVGSALDQLAATVVALAVFALPLSLIFLTHNRRERWFVLSFVLGCVLAGAAFSRLVASRGRRGSLGGTLVLLVGTGAVTWMTGFFAVVTGYLILINSSLCGDAPATGLAYIGAVVVYAIVGSWSLTGSGLRAVLGPSVGVVLGIAWALVTLAVVPGGHGYCET